MTFFRRVSSLLSLSALLVICGTLSAQAETTTPVETTLATPSAQPEVATQPDTADTTVTATQVSESANTYSFSATAPTLFANHTESTSSATAQVEAAAPLAAIEALPEASAEMSTEMSPEMSVETAKTAPVPGTTVTSAQVLNEQPAIAPTTDEAAVPTTETEAPKIAQSVEPGRGTRSGSSYVGVGLNVGITGDTALGDTNFTVLSKIGLTRTISVRPSVMIGDDADILIPVTLDFPSYTADEIGISAAPYVGAGVAITTGDSDVVRLLLTGGVDVPLTPQFTATAAVNAAVFDDTDIGLLLGVGYNFTSR
ncbi:hypothetical protein [Trichocoleus sp. FACHB-262]|uniref:hypothetical protein n=1 Tax=Trichocoleus sp. FACHB-262 TaxID=2692869 RepID=UPI001685BDF1|nr:hypothetical protein [Trichocoleus sp. FACHB-262]MBD2121107.1 hypothetical protein [Trichocoleus sp. FACHB-262]